jgi:hypothetical protein
VLNDYGDYSVNYPILTPFECINRYPIVVNDPQKTPIKDIKGEKNPQKEEKNERYKKRNRECYRGTREGWSNP